MDVESVDRLAEHVRPFGDARMIFDQSVDILGEVWRVAEKVSVDHLLERVMVPVGIILEIPADGLEERQIGIAFRIEGLHLRFRGVEQGGEALVVRLQIGKDRMRHDR